MIGAAETAAADAYASRTLAPRQSAIRNLQSAIALLALFVAVAAADAGRPAMMLDGVADQPRLVFGEADVHSIMTDVVDALRGKGPANAGSWWVRDASERWVSIAVGDGRAPAVRGHGSGKGLWAAVRNAAQGLRKAGFPRSDSAHVLLDIIAQVGEAERVRFNAWPGLAFGRDGLAFPQTWRKVLFPSQLVTGGVRMVQGMVSQPTVAALFPEKIHQDAIRRGNAPVQRFRTVSLFTDGRKSCILTGGHRAAQALSREDLAASLKLMTEAFVRASRDDGSFVYLYNPVRDREALSYNVPRQAPGRRASAHFLSRSAQTGPE